MNSVSQRIRQVVWAVSAVFANPRIDNDTVKIELTEAEKRLYYAMSNIDQYHTYRVYRSLQNFITSDEYKEIRCSEHYYGIIKKAALLHDVGRRNGEFTILLKIFSVIIDRVFDFKSAVEKKEIVDRIISNKRPHFLYIYYNHPQLSKKLLESIGSDEDLLYLVEQHHNNFDYHKRCINKNNNNYDNYDNYDNHDNHDNYDTNDNYDKHDKFEKRAHLQQLLQLLQKADALN